MLRSDCDRAGCLQGNGPPQQLVDHRPGGGFELRETRVHAALDGKRICIIPQPTARSGVFASIVRTATDPAKRARAEVTA